MSITKSSSEANICVVDCGVSNAIFSGLGDVYAKSMHLECQSKKSKDKLDYGVAVNRSKEGRVLCRSFLYLEVVSPQLHPHNRLAWSKLGIQQVGLLNHRTIIELSGERPQMHKYYIISQAVRHIWATELFTNDIPIT